MQDGRCSCVTTSREPRAPRFLAAEGPAGHGTLGGCEPKTRRMVFRAVPTRIAGGPTWLGSAQAAAPRRAGAPARFGANAGCTLSSHARVRKRRQCVAADSAHGLPELAST